jgi:hypothetical protein
MDSMRGSRLARASGASGGAAAASGSGGVLVFDGAERGHRGDGGRCSGAARQVALAEPGLVLHGLAGARLICPGLTPRGFPWRGALAGLVSVSLREADLPRAALGLGGRGFTLGYAERALQAPGAGSRKKVSREGGPSRTKWNQEEGGRTNRAKEGPHAMNDQGAGRRKKRANLRIPTRRRTKGNQEEV